MKRSAVALACLLGVFLLGCDTNEPEGVRVVRYEGPPIDINSARGWTVDIDGSGLVTIRTDTTHPGFVRDINGIWTLVLLDTRTALPDFVSLAVAGPSGRSATLVSGTIYIQDWDLSQVISGHVVGRTIPPSSTSGDDAKQLIVFWSEVAQSSPSR